MKISHVGKYAQKLRVGSNLLFQFFWRKIYTWPRNFMRRNIWCGNLAHFLPAKLRSWPQTEKHWVRCCDTTPASTIRAPWTRDLLTFKEYYGGFYWKASQLVGSIFIFIYLFIFIFFIFLQKLSTSQFLCHCELSAFVGCSWQTFSQNNLVTALMRNKDAHKTHAQRNILVLFSKSYQVNNVLDIEVISRALRV